MKSVYSLILTLFLAPAVIPGEPAKDKQPNPNAKRAAELVDAIANRNMAPEIVKWTGGITKWAALFPEGYDWKEEYRARNAISELEKDRTEEVWEEMARRSGDRRYAETVTSEMTGSASVEDVGSICSRLAESRLIGVYWQHLPLSPIKDGQKLELSIAIADLSTWRKQRAGKPLYELQLEVCDRAIEALAKVEEIPRARKNEAKKKIEAEIANLKRSKAPSREGGYYFDERGVYNPELAKRVRDAVKSGKYGDLGIIK